MKRCIRLLGIAVLLALFGAELFILSNSVRAGAYLGFYRVWHAVWPFTAGQRLPEDSFHLFGLVQPVWLEVEPGVTMRLDPKDMVTRAILVNRTWEPSTTDALMRRLPPGGTFVDVGAHVGWYSLKAAKVVGPNGRVIAIDPNREILAELRANIAASKAASIVTVVPVACAASESTLTFYATARGNTGESSLARANASQDFSIAASYPVRARRLDDILKDAAVSRVDEIKIDVEGAEFLVLQGAADTLARFRPLMAVEVNDRQLKAMGSSAAEVTAFLRSHGYEAEGRHEENVLFVPAR